MKKTKIRILKKQETRSLKQTRKMERKPKRWLQPFAEAMSLYMDSMIKSTQRRLDVALFYAPGQWRKELLEEKRQKRLARRSLRLQLIR